MGITLIFVSRQVVTDLLSRSSSLDWMGGDEVPGNSPCITTVPETDTGGQVEHTQALERMTLKELGNLPP
jgi:hypothetical protein